MGIDDVIERVNRAGDTHRRTMKANSPWLPKADSPLWGVYGRYCEETGQTIGAKVGRCHFWHIILMLAPLRCLGQYLSNPTGISFPVALLLMALVAGVECLMGWVFGNWWGFPITVAGIVGLVGVIVGLGLYMYLNDSPNNKLMKTVKGILSEDEKISWGAIFALLIGPAVLVGLLAAYLIHQVCSAIYWSPVGDFVQDHGVKVLKAVFLAAAGVVLGLSAFHLFVKPFGWTVLGGFVCLVTLVCLLTHRSMPKIDGFNQAVGQRWERRKQERQAAVAVSGPVRRPSLIRRIFGGIKTALCVVRDVVRLAITAVIYGYKQICDLAPVPQHLWKKEEETAATA